MRTAVLLTVLAVGCQKSPEPTTPEPVAPGATPQEEPAPKDSKTLDEYANWLMKQTPVSVEMFKDFNLKADRYEVNPDAPFLFQTITIEVDRVYLRDAITGKGNWYTHARLTAGKKPHPEPYGWVKVDMLP